MTNLNHIGMFVRDLETSKQFFEKYFGVRSGEIYHNTKKLFSSYMLVFANGAKLEIMTRPGLCDTGKKTDRYGLAHISISVGSKGNVDTITRQLTDDGFKHIDGPRTTGDGFYESTILDAEGNVIEITI